MIQKWLFRPFTCLWMTFAVTPVTALDCGSVPTPYEANYSVTRNGDSNGSMQVLLERYAVGSFVYSMDTYVKWGVFTAHITEQSEASLRNGVVLPGHFESTHQVSFYKRREKVDFDWVSMQASGTKKGKDFEMDIRPGMQDKLTVYLQIARSICKGQYAIDIDVVSGPELKRYDYQLQALEPLDTVLGELRVIHIRRGAPGDKKQTDLWHAAEAQFLPVKMVYRDGDIITDMRLKDISFRNED
ncbi:MAG: DUF3108 domain-containing protein [Lysobacterales bacterium]